jgi:hypothetical protein
MTYKLIIPRWTPVAVNILLHCHWATAARRKAVDRNLIAGYCLFHRLPIATGPRRVDLLITRGKSQRGRDGDPDCFWKSLLDSLVHAKMLIDDSRRWVQLGSVTFDRGPERATTITLTDINGDQI